MKSSLKLKHRLIRTHRVQFQVELSRPILYKQSGYFSPDSKKFIVYFWYWNPQRQERIEQNVWRNL